VDGLSLAGRIALITGGAHGIGKAVCQELAALGAHVIIADIDDAAANDLAKSLPAALAVRIDLDNPEDIARCAEDVRQTVDQVDILVNNGGATLVERFAQSDPASWDRLWRINLRAPIQLSRLLVPGMVERNWGRVIFVSSDSARVGAGGEVVYSAVKAGLLGLAKSLARETARAGVTSNVVCPGLIDTAMLRGVAESSGGLMDKLLASIPMRRLGTVDEVSSLISYLCTERAAYLTGQVFSVSGGVTMA
jgi:2-hydroxycyclohexanecarboxyl-CoA dehydrogenase